jgi:hypothetical protein
MHMKTQFEKLHCTFHYEGIDYVGDIVCSNTDLNIYWFVFDESRSVSPIGQSIEFQLFDGCRIEPVQNTLSNESFINCLKDIVQQHVKDICQ